MLRNNFTKITKKLNCIIAWFSDTITILLNNRLMLTLTLIVELTLNYVVKIFRIIWSVTICNSSEKYVKTGKGLNKNNSSIFYHFRSFLPVFVRFASFPNFRSFLPFFAGCCQFLLIFATFHQFSQTFHQFSLFSINFSPVLHLWDLKIICKWYWSSYHQWYSNECTFANSCGMDSQMLFSVRLMKIYMQKMHFWLKYQLNVHINQWIKNYW